MADRPSVTLKVNVAGAGAAAAQLDEIAKAQANVADATADAAKAAAAQGDAGAAAQGKLSKLWAGLKEGAGAAAGAAAGLAGMAVTLKGQLSPETQTAVAGLQGLSGVLAAFGPVGALASVAVSGAAAALALFDDNTELATVTGEGFLDKALKPMIEAMVTIADKADAATSSVKRMQVATQSEFEIFTPAEVIRADRLRVLIAENTLAVQTLGREVEQYERKAGALAADGSSVWSPQTAAIQEQAKALQLAADKASTYRFELDDLQRKAREREAGPAAPAARSAAPRAVDSSIADSVAFFTRQAEMAQANLVGAFTAAAAVAEQDAARVAEASAAAAAKYSAQVAQAIAAGASAQQDAIRGIEQDAARLIGIYDDLTTGVADFGKAAGEGFAAAAVSAAIYGGSLKEAANQALQAATVTAATEALIATAKGLGYLAAGAFGYAPGLAAAKASFAAAATWGVIAGGAAAGAAATGGFGGGGAGGAGAGSLGPGGAPSALDRPAAAEAPQDREFNINFAAGAGGRPLSRGDARAVATALIDIFATGGLRLEASRA